MLKDKLNKDILNFSGLRPMDLCRLQVYELVNPTTSFHVSRVFGPPLAVLSPSDHSELNC